MNNGSPQFQMPPITKTNKILMIGVVALFLLNSLLLKFSGFSLLGIFGLSPVKLLSGHIYQLVTYPLVNSSLMSVIFDCLLLWFLGCELERMWGTRRYLNFILTTIVGAGILYTVIMSLFFSGNMIAMYPFSGLGGLASAMCVAYAVLFPTRLFSFMMIFPIQAKYFCLILIGMSLYSGFFTPGGAGAWGQLGAMLCGFLWMIFVANKGGGLPKFGNKKKSRPKSRANLHIVKDEDEKPPRYWQ
ncbi:rhomboid family intramembrane serine protease [Halobacteriovorax sp. GB3]|uniref:rhomboid family intramembrane serine protease n=1 Tax=Halobacteriovorax sp. GB3 TaxID=2719615 RepID=UPI00235F411E|nr:rhomboid family intramembrane serine protease [Halobacteriovorax sp. GB3]MDD0852212.1 rhomboid family intramembrane serine protease [Halobacteriovorax sp. GB3]